MLLQGPGAGAGPATHAFVLGVSRYPFLDGPDATPEGLDLGMHDLTTAARSASEMTAWLLEEYRNPDAPLADVTLFLSPAEGEELNPVVVARLAGAEAPALRDAVEVQFNQFRETCRSHPDNVALVYVVGHGIQLDKHGAVVLLEDFLVPGRNLLYGALDVEGCRRSMDEDGNAAHQVWFSDACRQRPEIVRRFETLGRGYAPDERPGRVAASPIFLAAATREQAFATVKATTIFNQALLWALRGGVAAAPRAGICPEWHVPSNLLEAALGDRVRELLADVTATQTVVVTGNVANVITQRLDGPPDVDIEVTLDPQDLAPPPTAELLFQAEIPQEVMPGWPLRFRGPPGIYQVRASGDGVSGRAIFMAGPPRHSERIEVR